MPGTRGAENVREEALATVRSALAGPCLCVLLLLLPGCGGSGVTTAAPKTAAGGNTLGTTHLRIEVPSGTSLTAVKKPAYVSPSTASIVVAVDSVNGVAENPVPTQEADLTASNTADCAPPTALAPLTCTVPITAPVGTDVLTLTTYDQTGGNGNVLSVNSISTTIAQGTNNLISVTLAGVPVSVATVPVSGLTATGNSAYTMSGGTAELLVEPLDADANIIVGPGAPLLAIAGVSTSSITAAFATATTTNPNPNPNLVNLTKVYGSGSATTVSFTATPPENASPPTSTGAGSGVSGSFAVLAPLDIFVGTNGSVQKFVTTATSPAGSFSQGAPELVHDGIGNEYAVVPTDTEILGWPIASFPSSGVGYAEGASPVAEAATASGGLAFLGFDCCGTFVAYYPPGNSGGNYTQFVTVGTATSGTVSAAFDPTGTTLYVANANGLFKVTNLPTSPSVSELSSSYTSGQLAVDGLGDVFVNDGASGVVAFAPSNFSSPAATYAVPANCSVSGTVASTTFAAGTGTSLASDPVIVEAEYDESGILCWSYASYPTAAVGSPPSAFSSESAVLSVTGGGQFVLGNESGTVSVYPSLWSSASYSVSAGSAIVTALDSY